MRGWLSLWLLLLPMPALADDFWAYWGDGKGEIDSYRLVQPRYGHNRAGTAVLIYVTEDFSESARVKADEGKHPVTDVFPVLKLNAVRHFRTGIYDYHVMTSTFAHVSPGWPVAKASFSSQEWCGHVYHQLLPHIGKIDGISHSYFDGEADGKEELAMPKDGVLEDALPILLRGWGMAYMKPGESKSVPLLGSLLRARLEHKPLAWGQATISRSAEPATIVVPAGKYVVDTWTVAIVDGPTLTYEFEAKPPYRLARWSTNAGEKGELLASIRSPYWKLNKPGDESNLKLLKLP